MDVPTDNCQTCEEASSRPLCDEATFAEILESIVADEAPRLYAVVQEWGTRVDARVAAWGMVFENDRGVAMTVDGSATFKAGKPEILLPGFRHGAAISARIVWFNPDARTPEWQDDAEPDVEGEA